MLLCVPAHSGLSARHVWHRSVSCVSRMLWQRMHLGGNSKSAIPRRRWELVQFYRSVLYGSANRQQHFLSAGRFQEANIYGITKKRKQRAVKSCLYRLLGENPETTRDIRSQNIRYCHYCTLQNGNVLCTIISCSHCVVCRTVFFTRF